MIVYIAGPYRSTRGKADDVDYNIKKAKKEAIEWWREGASVICPHCNSMYFEKYIPDQEIFIQGDLELVGASHVIVLLPGWETSEGARREREHAIKTGRTVLYRVKYDSDNYFIEGSDPGDYVSRSDMIKFYRKGS